MKIYTFKAILILLIPIILYSCQSAKDALQGKKRSKSADEFLVEKKNPLALPPDFEKLPMPGNQQVSTETFSDDSEEVKDLLKIKDSDETPSSNANNSNDIESAIIKKIQ